MEINGSFETPYYLVLFTSVLSDRKIELYSDLNDELVESIKDIEGYLGHDSSKSDVGVTAIYFKDLESIDRWRKHPRHQFAKKLGISDFYDSYHIRIAKVEYDRGFVRQ